MRALLWLCQTVLVLSASYNRNDLMRRLKPLVVPCVESCEARLNALNTLRDITPIPLEQLGMVNSNPEARECIQESVLNNLYVLGVTGDDAKKAADVLLGNPRYYLEVSEEALRVMSRDGLQLPIPYEASQLRTLSPEGMEMYIYDKNQHFTSTVIWSILTTLIVFSLFRNVTLLVTGVETWTSLDITQEVFKMLFLVLSSSCTLLSGQLYESCSIQEKHELANTLESFTLDSAPPVCIPAKILSPNTQTKYPDQLQADQVARPLLNPVEVHPSETKLYNPDDMFDESIVFVGDQQFH